MVESMPGGLRVTVRPRRIVFAMLFLPVWLVGWAFGLVMAGGALFSGRAGPGGAGVFLVVWLALWMLGGGAALLWFLWMVAGRESIEVGGTVLRVRREIFGVGRTRDYDAREVVRLRVTPVPWWGAWDMRTSLKGPITFDYGAKTVHLGGGLDEAEAAQLIERFGERLPRRDGR